MPHRSSQVNSSQVNRSLVNEEQISLVNEESTSKVQSEWHELKLRCRFIGQAVLVCACIGWAFSWLPFDDLVDRNGKPLGGDFIMLYTAGSNYHQHDAIRLYDDALNQTISNIAVPGMDPRESWPYRYPPTVAWMASAISPLSFPIAFGVFCVFQACLLGSCCFIAKKLIPQIQWQSDWLWFALGAPLVIECFIGGQLSFVACFCVLATVFCLRQQMFNLAGVVLAISLYKPSVLILFSLGVIICYPRIAIGYCLTLLAGLSFTAWSCGVDSIVEYATLGQRLATGVWSFETPQWKVHGLAPWFQMLTPAYSKLLCLLTGLSITAAIGSLFRMRRIRPMPCLACLLVVNLLFSPYVPIYDLVLLLPAIIFWIAGRTERQPASSNAHSDSGKSQRVEPWSSAYGCTWVLGLVWFGPHLSQAIASKVHIQVFPLLLLFIALYGAYQHLKNTLNAPSHAVRHVAALNKLPMAVFHIHSQATSSGSSSQ